MNIYFQKGDAYCIGIQEGCINRNIANLRKLGLKCFLFNYIVLPRRKTDTYFRVCIFIHDNSVICEIVEEKSTSIQIGGREREENSLASLTRFDVCVCVCVDIK